MVLSHSSLTTDIVESGTVELPLPSFLTYHSHTTLDDSVSVVVSNVASTVSIKVKFFFIYELERVAIVQKYNKTYLTGLAWTLI